MDQQEILDRLQPVFQDILDNPKLHIGPDDSALTVEGWDSLAHINLVSAVEQEFRIRFALGEINELKNVGEMADLIARKLQKR